MIFGLTDETYSLVTQAKVPEGIRREDYCFWVTLLNHSYWIAGCILGAVVGTVVPIDFSGVSFVLTALFVTIFVEQWLSNKDHFPAMVGIVCTTLSLLGFGSDIFLIPAMAAIALILILRRRFGKEAAHG
jgi:4-azaleucine resistance transporter AzlC